MSVRHAFDGDSYMTAATLGNLTGKTIRVVMRDISIDTSGDVGYLCSQAGSSSGSREFGLWVTTSSDLNLILNGEAETIATTAEIAAEYGGATITGTLDLEVNMSTRAWTLSNDGGAWLSGTHDAGSRTNRVDGMLFRLGARNDANSSSTGGGWILPSGSEIGDTDVYLDSVLERTYVSAGGTTSTWAETTNSNDGTLQNAATDGSQWVGGAADTTAPVLTSATDAANGSSASTGSVSTDEGNGTLYWVVTTSATAPSVAQIQAGQDNSGVAATASGNQAVSATGSQAITPSGLSASTAYTTHFQHADSAGNDSTVVSASGFTTTSGDVTSPILSSPSGAVASATSADLSVSTDEGNGTLYWVVTTSATSPSIAQVQAGQDHTGASATSGNQAVSGTGTQNATATGLTTDTTYYAHFQHQDAAANDSTVSSSTAFTPGTETVGLTDDFDSAIGTVGTITSAFTSTPTIPLVPDDQGDVTGWQMVYCRVSGVDGKTPSFTLDLSSWRDNGGTGPVAPWQMVWRYVDDATVPADGRPLDWNLFDNDTSPGAASGTFSMNSAFNQDDVEVAFSPRWRYIDSQRAFDYVAAHSYFSETTSSASFGGSDHVHAQIAVTSGTNSAAGTTLDYHCALLDDTSSQPAGGEDKLNVVMLFGHHAGEDAGDYAFWETVYGYTDGTGTTWDWFRQHCRLYLYDVNMAGRYYGKERYTEEDNGNEDPNRAWDDTGSTQVNAVKAAVQADVSRIDVFLDFHVFWRLNGNAWSQETGVYLSASSGHPDNDFESRASTAVSPATIRTISTSDAAGMAVEWADLNTDSQVDVIVEFPHAMDSGYPSMESQYATRMEQYISALEAMADNSELTFTNNASTITGTGALSAQNSVIVGDVFREITSSGALSAQAVTIAGTSARVITANGVLLTQASTTNGSGGQSGFNSASGDLVSDVATMSGVGVKATSATGALQAQDATMSGVATRTITGSGVLVTNPSQAFGFEDGVEIGGSQTSLGISIGVDES